MNNQFTDNNDKRQQEPMENALVPAGDKKKKRKGFKFTKKTGALLMTGGIVLSGAFGFGGGMLANQLNGGKTVMYQSV
ncbi:MAG: serine protease HtrA, partial [Eubacterium sp.]